MPMRANTVPTGTSVPIEMRSSSIIPDSNTSTSTSLFSVSTSATMSPRRTRSPGFTRHSMTVPTSMSAPRKGMRNSPTATSVRFREHRHPVN